MINDPYLFALLLGGIGLVAMAALGLGGRGHGAPKGHHAPGGRGHHSGPGQAHHTSAAHPAAHRPSSGGRWLLMLSPFLWFSLLVGFGAAGMLVHSFAAGWLRLAVAVAGALAFHGLLIRPLWNALSRFESRPASMLEHGVMDEARAVTGFNSLGEGLARIDLDGQVVQLLARLAPADVAAGVKVRPGDRLIVESVDTRRQQCTVSAPDAEPVRRPPQPLQD